MSVVEYAYEPRCYKVKIEIWSDFTCPYCFLGKKRFDLALEQFGKRDAVEIEFKSFELAPDAGVKNNIDWKEMWKEKYRMTTEEITRMEEEINWQGKELGLDIIFDDVIHTNTFPAHRLVKYSNENNRAHLLIDLLFNSHFIRKENIGKRDVLHQLAMEAGLDREETDALLCLNHYAKAVRHDEEIAEEIGISVVPFFIFNEEYAISGLQPTEVFMSVLNELWEEEAAVGKTQQKKKESSFCDGNGCSLDEIHE